MKNKLTGLTSLLILHGVFTALIFQSCEKNIVENNDSWKDYYVDSIGFKHNMTLSKVIDKITVKEEINYEEAYNLLLNQYCKDYNIEIGDFPTYSELADKLQIVRDTTISFEDKFKLIHPNFTSIEIEYINEIENIVIDAENTEQATSAITNIEENIILNTSLSNEQKGNLINLTDSAKHSYEFWDSEFSNKSDEYAYGWRGNFS